MSPKECFADGLSKLVFREPSAFRTMDASTPERISRSRKAPYLRPPGWCESTVLNIGYRVLWQGVGLWRPAETF